MSLNIKNTIHWLYVTVTKESHQGKPFPPLLALNFFYAFSFSVVFLGPGEDRNQNKCNISVLSC